MLQECLSLTSVVDTVSDAIIWLDGNRKIIYMNHAAAAHFGHTDKGQLEVSIEGIFPSLAEERVWDEIVDFFHPPQVSQHLPKSLEMYNLDNPASGPAAQTIITKIDCNGQPIYSIQVCDSSIKRVITEEQYKNDLAYHELVEDTLKKSREQLARAIEGSGVGLWEWNLKTNEIAINERWAEIIGYTTEELGLVTIETWNQLGHSEDLKQSYTNLLAHFNGELPFYECELRMRHKDGHWVWILDRGRITERDEHNQPARVTGTHLDISERRSMQDKIIYRSQFEDLLMQISTRFINLGENEIDVEINNALKEIGKFERVDRSYVFMFEQGQTLMSNTHEWCAAGIEPQIDVLQAIPAETMPWWMAQMEKREPIKITRLSELPPEAATEKEILEMQSILSIAVIPMVFQKHLLGFIGFDSVAAEKEWTTDSVALLRMFANILSGALERKHSESALRQSEARNAAMVNAIPDMMFRIREDGTFLDYALPNELELTISRDQIIGSTIFNMFTQEVGQQALVQIQAAIRSGKKQTFLYELLIPVIGLQHFEARIVANADDEVIAIVRNISERIHLEQMKSDFINRATHDLRTPLTTILMMVHLLEDDPSPEEYQQFWSILKSELTREHNLIEDLLMVGRLESNRWEIKMRPMDPMESLNSSVQSLYALADSRNIALNLSVQSPIPRVDGDPSALQQVFTNLINNAIKFTPVGGGDIFITAWAHDQRVWFKIEDTGMGIPPEDIPNLFSRFFRGRNATDAEVSGSGIGLFIVKSIIENLGGEIQVHSVLNQGTSFQFSLPELTPTS